ncbi:ISH14-type transposase [Halalkaliarchaeum desulfuricum]|uniref:ISH14-type transposase n=1 Tax=Halalkaliarchaeum desulfuricum TaxID=2055893 RepID=A0A343TMY0_9EURY|nr:ISH14-type transposase [Halalkaliarchaeum desulfuricum]
MHMDGCVYEREATPRFLMKLGIQLYLAELFLLNIISLFDIFGIKRARSTVHNWVHKADLQHENGLSPDHVAVDETVIGLNDEQCWLYAAVGPQTNKLLYTQLEPTTNSVLVQQFLAQHREKHDVDDAVFLTDGSLSLKDACTRHGLDLRVERHEDHNSVEHIY